MAMRTIGQVTAGFVAGALLVGVPSWALADDDGKGSDSSQMMSEADTGQMMKNMSQIMKDPEIRKEMASMMSEMMAQMPDMSDGENGEGMRGMRGMSDMK